MAPPLVHYLNPEPRYLSSFPVSSIKELPLEKKEKARTGNPTSGARRFHV
jgi:hypothetical protein